VASTLQDYKIPVVPWKIYDAAKELGGMESGLKAFKKTFAKIVGATLSSGDRRSLGRRHWEVQVHGDILKSIADEEYMAANGLTSWAAATPEQLKGRQQAHNDAKIKCVSERGGLAKASRDVVDFVGNTQMPKWNETNKEAVEMHAIELRHQLGYYFQHRVKYTRSQRRSTSGTKPLPLPRTRMQNA
jgi:hypothetical protein